MKIRLGPAGTPTITSKGTLEGIKDVAKLGLSALEVQFTYGVKMSPALARKIGKTAEDLDVKLSVHAPYYINLCQQDRIKLNRSRKWILLCAERAKELGAEIITFHPGAYGKLSSESAVKYVTSVCRELSEQVSADVRLGLETTGKKGQFGTLDEIIEICKKVKACVPVIDFAHIYARNGGKIDYPEIFKKLRELKLKFYHSHFSNVAYTERGEKHHLVLNGSPAFKPLAQAVLNNKKDIVIISESPILEQDSLKMKKIFERLGHRF